MAHGILSISAGPGTRVFETAPGGGAHADHRGWTRRLARHSHQSDLAAIEWAAGVLAAGNNPVIVAAIDIVTGERRQAVLNVLIKPPTVAIWEESFD